MTIVIKSEEINKNLEKFIKLFTFMKESNIQYELRITTYDEIEINQYKNDHIEHNKKYLKY